MTKLLQVTDLTTCFPLHSGTCTVVDGVSFSLSHEETLALVGESGCGKSMTALSLMRLVPSPGRIRSGSIHLDGTNILNVSEKEMRHIRGNRMAMVFQEPMTSLNPVFTVGEQIAEGIRLHRSLSNMEAKTASIDLLRRVGIPAPELRCTDFPHQMSGGMRQRVMIAMALACRPQLLIADEPTTALDVTIQAQIMELIDDLQAEFGMGLLLITHDLGIVAERAHHTAIMYAGKIVERGPTDKVLNAPSHPYTVGLLASLPQKSQPGTPLPVIPGQVPSLLMERPGCGFCDRCPDKTWRCAAEQPPETCLAGEHRVRCWKYT